MAVVHRERTRLPYSVLSELEMDALSSEREKKRARFGLSMRMPEWHAMVLKKHSLRQTQLCSSKASLLHQGVRSFFPSIIITSLRGKREQIGGVLFYSLWRRL